MLRQDFNQTTDDREKQRSFWTSWTAIGAARLIDLVNTLDGGVGTNYKNPKVLLICPPPLSPEIEKGPVFAEMFKGGLEKSKQLPALYEAVAKMGGAEYLNAGSVVSIDGSRWSTPYL